MASVSVTPLGDGRTRVTHLGSGEGVTTDSSPEWGGGGRSFSATDLVAAGLGACIGSSIAGVLERRDIDLAAVRVEVSKTLGEEPKKIDHLDVVIHLPGPEDPQLGRLVGRAAASCAVGRSISCGETVTVVFE
jgi:uncharacterized OsmC-like protein